MLLSETLAFNVLSFRLKILNTYCKHFIEWDSGIQYLEFQSNYCHIYEWVNWLQTQYIECQWVRLTMYRHIYEWVNVLSRIRMRQLIETQYIECQRERLTMYCRIYEWVNIYCHVYECVNWLKINILNVNKWDWQCIVTYTNEPIYSLRLSILNANEWDWQCIRTSQLTETQYIECQ